MSMRQTSSTEWGGAFSEEKAFQAMETAFGNASD